MAVLAYDEVMLREPQLLVPKMAPVGNVTIETAHPLARALAFAWVPTARRDMVSGTLPNTNTATPAGTPYGLSAVTNDDGFNCLIWNTERCKTSAGNGTGDFTVLVFANPGALRAEVDALLVQKYDDAGAPYAQVVLAGNISANGGYTGLEDRGRIGLFIYNTSSSDYAISANTAIDGNYHVFIGMRSATACSVYRDGVNVTVSSNGGSLAIADDKRRTGIGYSGKSTNAEGADANFLCSYMWNRALSAAEIVSVSAEPFQMICPA